VDILEEVLPQYMGMVVMVVFRELQIEEDLLVGD
jgi:hypothetical protein